jgi:RNA polymerase-binding transcription factor DksA
VCDSRAGAYKSNMAIESDSTSSHAQLCSVCHRPISPARLEAFPGVKTCIECAKKYPLKVDTSTIELSEASPINRNGFAPKD